MPPPKALRDHQHSLAPFFQPRRVASITTTTTPCPSSSPEWRPISNTRCIRLFVLFERRGTTISVPLFQQRADPASSRGRRSWRLESIHVELFIVTSLPIAAVRRTYHAYYYRHLQSTAYHPAFYIGVAFVAVPPYPGDLDFFRHVGRQHQQQHLRYLP